jgi:hypothetical protein
MVWNAHNDKLTFKLKFEKIPMELLNSNSSPGKRQIFKVIMSIFNPLRLIALPLYLKN